jgi:hypothetical protein
MYINGALLHKAKLVFLSIVDSVLYSTRLYSGSRGGELLSLFLVHYFEGDRTGGLGEQVKAIAATVAVAARGACATCS